jgi:hypothetical protein
MPNQRISWYSLTAILLTAAFVVAAIIDIVSKW